MALLGLFGKLNLPQALFFSFLYNFGWNLCHFITVLLQMHSPETRVVDDYQISNVYLFAAVFSFTANCFLRTPTLSKNHLYSHSSRIMALTGSFFVFLSFCTTTTTQRICERTCHGAWRLDGLVLCVATSEAR